MLSILSNNIYTITLKLLIEFTFLHFKKQKRTKIVSILCFKKSDNKKEITTQWELLTKFSIYYSCFKFHV